MPFTNIKINEASDELKKTLGGPGEVENNAKLDAFFTKWVSHAEANNIQADTFVADRRDKAQAAIDKAAKKLETIKADAKKGKSTDFKVVLEFKAMTKEVTDHASAVRDELATLFENMADYRGNGWVDFGKEYYSAQAMVDRFDKMRWEGMQKNQATKALAERIDEYEERATLFLSEVGDALISTIKDAAEKERRVRERVAELLAQVDERSETIVNTDLHQVTSKQEFIDSSIAIDPPTDAMATRLESRLPEMTRQLKRANGRIKTVKLVCEHIPKLAKGYEKALAAELKKAKDAVKPLEKASSDADKVLKTCTTKIEAYRKKLTPKRK